jgi:anti-sigma-K factor RskA
MSEDIDDIDALLPWYAAGVLSANERAKVEAALGERPELRASLAVIEEDRDETVALNEALGAPGPDVWARVLAGVQETPRKVGFLERVAAWFGPGEARLAPLALAGAAAALVILLQAGAIVALLPSTQKATGEFGAATSAIAPQGADVLVAFSPQATIADVSAFLRGSGATVVSGPKPGGLYELRVGDKPLSKPELDTLLKTLANSPVVKLALPGLIK